jgi:hypothetical protein
LLGGFGFGESGFKVVGKPGPEGFGIEKQIEKHDRNRLWFIPMNLDGVRQGRVNERGR